MFRFRVFTQFMVLCALLAASAQTPPLDPENTVNPATGEMGLGLRLTTLRGAAGKDFPIVLNYQAGIRTKQDASPLGLGFSYGTGSITRKVVYLPDDFSDPAKLYYHNDDPDCETVWWKKAIAIAVGVVVAIIVGIFTEGIGAPAAFGWVLTVFVGTIANMFVHSAVAIDPADFAAGGYHTPEYDFEEGDKKGFLAGGKDDIADIYFVNSPYVRGQLVWVGDAETGHFAFRTTQGSTNSQKATTRVRYDVENESWLITMADGTRLYFEKTQKSAMAIESDFKKFNPDQDYCEFTTTLHLKEAVPTQWLLTKVLFRDFVDGSGDLDPQNSKGTNSGAWICFNYDSIVDASIYKYVDNAQTQQAPFTRKSVFVGKRNSTFDGVKLCWLKEIVTPDEYAVFHYQDRLDDVWCQTGTTDQPYQAKGLTKVEVHNRSGTKIHEIAFETGYDLRPGTASSKLPNGTTLSGNPEAKSLTLRSVTMKDGQGNALPPIVFKYVAYNPDASDKTRTLPNNNRSAKIPRADLWGYYYPNTDNDWNKTGSKDKAETDGTPHAVAWSLEEINMPNGLRVKWDYELNRYDKANTQNVTSVEGSSVPKYTGGIRVRKVTADGGMGPGSQRTWYYIYTASDPQSAALLTETTANGSGHATVEPFPYFEEESGDNRPMAARGGLYTPTKIVYEQVAVVEGMQEGASPSAPQGYRVYTFTSPVDYPNEGEYGEVDHGWKRGFLKSLREYSAGHEVVRRVTSTRVFEEESNIYDLPSSADFASINRWFLLHRNNRFGIIKQLDIAETTGGVEKKTSYKYAYDGEVDEVADGVSYSKQQIDIRERSWGNVANPDYREGAFAVCTEMGDEQKDDIGVAYSLPDEVKVRVYEDFGAGETVNSTTVPFQFEAGSVGRVVGASFWDLDGDGMHAPELLLVVSRYNSVSCIVIWNARGSLSTTSEFQLCTLPLDHMRIVSCGITDFNSNGKPDFVLYEGDYDFTGRSMLRMLYGVRDMDVAGNHSGLYSIQSPVTLAGDDVRFIDYNADGNRNDLEIIGPQYDYSQKWGWCRHFVLEDVALVDAGMKVQYDRMISLPNVFETGRHDEGSTQPPGKYFLSLRFIGKDYSGEDDGGSYYGFITWDNESEITDFKLYDARTKLFARDYDALPNLTYEHGSSNTRITRTVPAFCRYPQMDAHNHLLSATAQTTVYSNTVTDANVVSARATTWNAISDVLSSGGVAPELSDPFPAAGATGAMSICGTTLLAWNSGSSEGMSVTYDLYFGQSANPPKIATTETTTQDRVGHQVAVAGNTQYYWKVVAYRQDGSSVASPVWSFTTGADQTPGHTTCSSAGWVKVLAPDGGESLAAGSVVYVQWVGERDFAMCPCVVVRYLDENGNWTIVSELTGQVCLGSPGDNWEWGYLGWAVPEALAGRETKLRVDRYCSDYSTGIYDESDGFVTVVPAQNQFYPEQSHAWKVPMTGEGLPSTASGYGYADFDFGEGADNPNWVLTAATERYGRFGNALCVKDALGVATTTCYGHSGLYPVATIENADFYEASVFTGTYDDDQESYFDKCNGWEHSSGNAAGGNGTVRVVTPAINDANGNPYPVHFGQGCVNVNNAWGPTRNCKLVKGRDYVMSAWVHAHSETGTVRMHGDYRKVAKDSDAAKEWPMPVANLTKLKDISAEPIIRTFGDTGPGWVYVQLSIPASTDLASEDWDNYDWYARMYVGCPTGGEALIDDVRFYPIGAVVTSMYYDQASMKPIHTIGPNNDPSRTLVYDGFERPLKWYKIMDKGKSAFLLSNLTATEEKVYHLMYELPSSASIQLNIPNGGQNYSVGERVAIHWVHAGTRSITLSYQKTGGSWSTIATQSSLAGGYHSYRWTVPSDAVGTTCKVKVSDGTNADESDRVFAVLQ